MATDKAPYRLTIKLDTVKTEKLTEAIAELREKLAEYDQTPASATTTIVIEAWQEAPMRAVMDSFETWLYYHAALDCEMAIKRPGVRPETIALLAREKRETPMDRIQGFAERRGAKVEFVTAPIAGDENLFEDEAE